MTESDSCAVPDKPTPPPPSRERVIRHFLGLTKELTGLPALDYKPSQSAALELFQVLEISRSEDEAKRSMQANPTGTLSLSYVTLAKASQLGWDLQPDAISTDKTSEFQMGYATLTASGAAWFFRQAIDEYPFE